MKSLAEPTVRIVGNFGLIDMKYERFYSTELKMSLMRVDKRTAKKQFELFGRPVWAIPCKVRPDNPWVPLTRFDKPNDDDNLSFDKLIVCFRRYNCNAETGSYPHYYIEAF